jgi:putative NIF3 family GTP cyclohydrolase 1 type 2
MSLKRLIAHVKERLGIDKLKYIGDPGQECRKIVLAPGASGGVRQIGMIQEYSPDVLICGELNEWETSEYVRDARYQGRQLGLIVLGHAVSEEPGLEWLVAVLREKVPGVTVTHIPSGDALSWA